MERLPAVLTVSNRTHPLKIMKALTKKVIGNCTLYHGDCFDILPRLALQADAVISDLPYNNTACDWDVAIPLAYFWHLISSKSKTSANYVLFAAGHFTLALANSKYNWFRYDLVWHKNNKAGFLNANKQPMRQHENILVFTRPGNCNEAAYNPQRQTEVYRRQTAADASVQQTANERDCVRPVIKIRKGGVYPPTVHKRNPSDGTLHPGSVLYYCKDKESRHPTQKPQALLEFLVKSYSNENGTVLDPFMGSGTAGAACALHGRNFIGIEKEKKYFDIAAERIKKFYENSRGKADEL